MKKLLTLILAGCALPCFSQSYVTIVIDTEHLAIVNENGAVRLAGEQAHNQMLDNIKKNLSTININLSSVALVQRMLYRSLSQVDQALRSGRALRQIGTLVQDISTHGSKMLEVARTDPWLLAVAEDTAKKLGNRGLALASEVSEFILSQGGSVLMDFRKRDQLLAKVTLELKVIRALLFSMERSIYWAKINGLWKTVNPYTNFINRDKMKAEEIIRNYHILTK